MNEYIKKHLIERNKKIIEIILQKAEKVCPKAIDLIAVTGSFHNGDYYEKSDLDLLIVINNDAGWNVSKCFILEDVAHDIYCHTWHGLEQMSEYEDPFIIKLMNVDIVYTSDEAAFMRYNKLKEKVQNMLALPFNKEDEKKIDKHYDSALKEYAKIMFMNDCASCKYQSALMLYYIEFILYMINKSYIQKGIKNIPEELSCMDALPENFMKLYQSLISANNCDQVKSTSTALIVAVDKWLSTYKNYVSTKNAIRSSDLSGTYEEIYSNWKNKMHYAAKTSDKYLSFMTTASCQNFYNNMFDNFDIAHYDLFSGFDIDDLEKSAVNFDAVMEQYKELYDKTSSKLFQYDSIHEFANDYLNNENE